MQPENLHRSDQSEVLTATTLAVYIFVAKSRWPVGTRDVVRGIGLSSSSVAFRYLQRLEALRLISKTESGEYILRSKAPVPDYFWIGKRLIPRMLVYSLFFLGVLAVEAVILSLHYEVENYEFKVFFFLLIGITVAAIFLFFAEGMRAVFRNRKQVSSGTELNAGRIQPTGIG